MLLATKCKAAEESADKSFFNQNLVQHLILPCLKQLLEISLLYYHRSVKVFYMTA